MNEIFEKIYAASNINTEESKQTELFEQIYKEAEMLNEMNPKLRAMLLGGALAAGLGMQSCSMPTDIPYDPPVIEQPGPSEETPSEETPDNPDNPDGIDLDTDDENNGDDENNETEDNTKENEEMNIEDIIADFPDLLNASDYYTCPSNMDLLFGYNDEVYVYENGTFSKVNTLDSFDGYVINTINSKGLNAAYLVPNEVIELFATRLGLNN